MASCPTCSMDCARFRVEHPLIVHPRSTSKDTNPCILCETSFETKKSSTSSFGRGVSHRHISSQSISPIGFELVHLSSCAADHLHLRPDATCRVYVSCGTAHSGWLKKEPRSVIRYELFQTICGGAPYSNQSSGESSLNVPIHRVNVPTSLSARFFLAFGLRVGAQAREAMIRRVQVGHGRARDGWRAKGVHRLSEQRIRVGAKGVHVYQQAPMDVIYVTSCHF